MTMLKWILLALAALVFLLWPLALWAGDIGALIPWEVNVSQYYTRSEVLTRGESIILEPQFVSAGKTPISLVGVYTVDLRLRRVGTTNWFVPATGVVYQAAAGKVRVPWTVNVTTGRYDYVVAVNDSDESLYRSQGQFMVRPNLMDSGVQETQSVAMTSLDWSTVVHSNLGAAPFLTSFGFDIIEAYVQSLQNGTGDVDANNVTVRGTLSHAVVGLSITNLSVTGYGTVTRTGPHSATINVTGDGGGSTGGGIGSYTNTEIDGVSNTNFVRMGNGSNTTWRLVGGVWVLDAVGGGGGLAEMPAVWDADLIGTNRLGYQIGGQLVGYYDLNGLTLLTGTLTLWEDDLNCNVRLYDGSRTSPSLTLYGHPNTMGLYARGYAGSWGFGFSHAGVDVLTINAGGLYTLSTNAVISGKHLGDLSECTGYPEPMFVAFSTNMVYPGFTILTNGVLSMQRAPWGYYGIVLNSSNSSVSLRDFSQTDRVKLEGDSGKITIRNAGGSITWSVDSADTFYTGVKTQFTRNAANTAMITNIITYKNGLVKTFLP